MVRSRWCDVVYGAFLLAVIGCAETNQYQPPPPPTVTVAQPLQKTVTSYLEETGTTEAVEEVEIRARVMGFIEEVTFEPGAEVEEGQTLYRIEPEQFQAEVDAAEAELLAQNANRDKAKIERDRQVNLQKEDAGATSEMAVVATRAEYEAAEAGVKAAQAALDRAKLDLKYTNVTAPISGRIGKTHVKVGNLVGDGAATLLTNLMRYDPIYANFNISERALLEIRERTTPEGRKEPNKDAVVLELRRATDEGFPYQGKFDYADLAVDQSMGTYLIRGIFPNPNRDIVPGLFVRVRIPIGKQQDALLVPERATGSDQAGRYVLVVMSDGTVERRDITLGTKVGEMVVVTEGLQADEWVLVDGVQRARPGAKVNREETGLTPPEGELESVQQGIGAMPDEAAEEADASEETPADAQGDAPATN